MFSPAGPLRGPRGALRGARYARGRATHRPRYQYRWSDPTSDPGGQSRVGGGGELCVGVKRNEHFHNLGLAKNALARVGGGARAGRRGAAARGRSAARGPPRMVASRTALPRRSGRRLPSSRRGAALGPAASIASAAAAAARVGPAAARRRRAGGSTATPGRPAAAGRGAFMADATGWRWRHAAVGWWHAAVVL